VIDAILMGLLKANLAAGAAVLFVLAVRKLVRSRFGARAAYALWLAPLAAAAAVLLPHPQLVTPMSPMVRSAETAAISMADEFVAQAPARAQTGWPDALTLLFAAWLAGTLAAGALVLWRQRRFTATMGRLAPSETEGLFRAESPDVGPAVVGVFRPRIVAPADFEARFAPDERALILSHERAHLAGGDAAINALACAAQCVSWFNPLVHLAVRALRIDQELACDAAVIGRFPAQRRAYAELLLKTQIASQPLPFGCHWPAGADHPLKERIAMLKSPLPAGSMRRMGLVVAAALSVGIGGLAWSAQPSHLEPADAAKLVGPGETFLCKPDANRELHNCEIKGSPFAVIATAADVQREWPAEAKKAGLTGWVTLQCAPNLGSGRFESCKGYHYGGAAERPDLQTAFEQAAVRVIGVIRLKTKLTAHDAVLPPAGFYTIEFNDHPAMLGGPPVGPPTTRYPDFLPDLHGRVAAPVAVKTPASYAPEHYVLPPRAAEPRTRLNGLQPAAFKSIWIKKPTGDDLVALYPAEAAKANVSAALTMTCRIASDGLLYGCSVGPVDLSADTGTGITQATASDFKSAAMRMTALFQMDPAQIDEAGGTDGMIRIPVRFALPRAPQPVTPS
jgi:beta-lactamase regulating signal transducer with metallopeptidase domain